MDLMDRIDLMLWVSRCGYCFVLQKSSLFEFAQNGGHGIGARAEVEEKEEREMSGQEEEWQSAPYTLYLEDCPAPLLSSPQISKKVLCLV